MDSFDWFNWVVLPLLIFISRLGDVTLATLRHIFISKGLKKIVPVLAFFEVLIWLVAIRQVFSNLNSIPCFIAWAGGFSLGTYVGMQIEEKIALGMQIIRIITAANYTEFTAALQKINQGYTIVDGHGAQGPVKLIFIQFRRKNKAEIARLIAAHLPEAFYSIEDIRKSEMGIFSRTSRN